MGTHVQHFLAMLRPSEAIPATGHDLDLLHCWLIETSLIRVRSWAALLCLLAILLFPLISWVWFVVAASTLALGNVILRRLLHAEIQAKQLRRVRLVATASEWTTALLLIGADLFSRQPFTVEPAILLVLVVVTAIRYGRQGLVRGVVASALVVGVLISVQVWVFGVLQAQQARFLLSDWLLVLSVMALVLGTWIHTENLWQRYARAEQRAVQATAQQLHWGLSGREREVLLLLAQEELSYSQIATGLNISPETIKTHVRHIGRKLGVRGRWAVVAVARERGLLPGDDDSFTPVDSASPLDPSQPIT